MAEDFLYHLELARGAYAQDAAGLARVSMLRECRVAKFKARVSIGSSSNWKNLEEL